MMTRLLRTQRGHTLRFAADRLSVVDVINDVIGFGRQTNGLVGFMPTGVEGTVARREGPAVEKKKE